LYTAESKTGGMQQCSGGSRISGKGGRGGEWPKATRGVGPGEGVSPSPLEWGLGRGCAPPQKNFEI